MVGINDYLGNMGQGESHGSSSSQFVGELNKALEVGHLRGGDASAESGGSLKIESLESTLKILSYKQKDMQCFQTIPKLPAYSTVEEYERLEDYGDSQGGFIGEGELPEENNSTYSRQADLVKYIGDTRGVTHQAQLTNTLVNNLIQREVQNGSLNVLRIADRTITKGNADVIPYEYNGIYKLQQNFFSTLNAWQDSDVVIDLKGGYLKEEYVEQGAESMINNHATADLFMAPPAVLSGFVKQFHGSKLIQPNTAQVTDGVMGQRVRAFASQFGDIALGYDKFLKQDNSKLLTDVATHSKAPATPVADAVAPNAPVNDGDGRFLTAFAGDYLYAVAAKNKYGTSAISALGTAATVGAAQSVDLKFAAGEGTYAATGYIIYKSEKDVVTGTITFYPVFEVSVQNLTDGYDGASAGLIRDRNRYIPNTDSAFLLENNDQVWSMKQLAPLMKMDLARTAPIDRFMILMYAVVHLYAPKKMVRYVNIGKYVSA